MTKDAFEKGSLIWTYNRAIFRKGRKKSKALDRGAGLAALSTGDPIPPLQQVQPSDTNNS